MHRMYIQYAMDASTHRPDHNLEEQYLQSLYRVSEFGGKSE